MTGAATHPASAASATVECAWRIHIPLCNVHRPDDAGHLITVEFALPLDRPPAPAEIFNGQTRIGDIRRKWFQAFGCRTFDAALLRALNLSQSSRTTGGWQRATSRGGTPAQWIGLLSFQRMLRITSIDAKHIANVQGDGSAELALGLALLAVGCDGPKTGTIIATGEIGADFTVGHVGGIVPKLKAIIEKARRAAFPAGTPVFFPAKCDEEGEVPPELIKELQEAGLRPVPVSHIAQAAAGLGIGHDARPMWLDRFLLGLGAAATSRTSRALAALAVASLLAYGLAIQQRDAAIEIAPVAVTMPDQDGKTFVQQSPFHYAAMIDNHTYVDPRSFCREGQASTVSVERHGYATYLRLGGNWIDELLWRASRSGMGLPTLGLHPTLVTLQHSERPGLERPFEVFVDQPVPGHPDSFGIAPGEVWPARVDLDKRAGDTLTLFAIGQRWQRIEADVLRERVRTSFRDGNLQGVLHFLDRLFAGRIRYICTFETVEKE